MGDNFLKKVTKVANKTIVGGLLNPDEPEPIRPAPAAEEQLDPNRGAQVSAARQAAQRRARAKGRGSLRIDLGASSDSGASTRSGITIR